MFRWSPCRCLSLVGAGASCGSRELLSRLTAGKDAWLAFDCAWKRLSFDELDRMLP